MAFPKLRDCAVPSQYCVGTQSLHQYGFIAATDTIQDLLQLNQTASYSKKNPDDCFVGIFL
jgi:hypothetical protein